MALYGGWESKIQLVWNYPLGTPNFSGTSANITAWLSENPDSLSIGAEPHERRVYGYRYYDNSHLKLLKATPAGALGAVPMWFGTDNNQIKLNRILNAHFQNGTFVTLGTTNAYFYPQPSQPGTWCGFDVFQAWGDGTDLYRFKSGVIDEMKFEWAPGKAMQMTPTFKFLNVNPKASSTGIITFSTDYDYMYQFMAPPNITTSWNGTAFDVAGFRITSQNNITPVFATTSKQPVGFVMGEYNAVAEIDVWMSDDFINKYVGDYLGTSISLADVTGTFLVKATGPVAGESNVHCMIQMIGKIIEIPSISPKSRNESIVTYKLTMTGVGTGADSPFYVFTEGAAWSPEY